MKAMILALVSALTLGGDLTPKTALVQASAVDFAAEYSKLDACVASVEQTWPSIDPEGRVTCVNIPAEPPSEEAFVAVIACLQVTTRDSSRWPNITEKGEVSCVPVVEGLRKIMEANKR